MSTDRYLLNDSGQHLVAVGLERISDGTSLGPAILSQSASSSGGFGAVIQEGDPAPGIADHQFSFAGALGITTELGNAGHVAVANLLAKPDSNSGSNKSGVWLRSPGEDGELELVYRLRRNRDDVDEIGYLDGLSFGASSAGANFETRAFITDVNASGQVAFEVQYHPEFTGGAPTGRTIYATDPYGDVQLIARTGLLLDVNDDPLIDDFRIVDELTSLGFNDRSELLFRASFNGGSSGLFVANLDGIPGDYNLDGLVDAADYTVWRDGLGTTYDQSDYDVWVNNFGATASTPSNAVPEPSTGLLLLTAAVLLRRSRRR